MSLHSSSPKGRSLMRHARISPRPSEECVSFPTLLLSDHCLTHICVLYLVYRLHLVRDPLSFRPKHRGNPTLKRNRNPPHKPSQPPSPRWNWIFRRHLHPLKRRLQHAARGAKQSWPSMPASQVPARARHLVQDLAVRSNRLPRRLMFLILHLRPTAPLGLLVLRNLYAQSLYVLRVLVSSLMNFRNPSILGVVLVLSSSSSCMSSSSH